MSSLPATAIRPPVSRHGWKTPFPKAWLYSRCPNIIADACALRTSSSAPSNKSSSGAPSRSGSSPTTKRSCASSPPFSSRSTKHGRATARFTSSGNAGMGDHAPRQFPDVRLHKPRPSDVMKPCSTDRRVYQPAVRGRQRDDAAPHCRATGPDLAAGVDGGTTRVFRRGWSSIHPCARRTPPARLHYARA